MFGGISVISSHVIAQSAFPEEVSMGLHNFPEIVTDRVHPKIRFRIYQKNVVKPS